VIRGGRHPLLEETRRAKRGGDIIPLDISIGDGKRGLIISGPNAGGKTVALKTIGVLALLARTGLHVPCGDGTEIGLFGKIFVDIGDEQSIELSLSTFSSHMKNVVKVLAEADSSSLVLLDELGAGTDPAEGTALARAVIEDLLASGATIVATTHHMDLKVLAHENPLLENASMEFDGHDLVPTYRLIQGVPGASHAFEIASRLGLGDGTLGRARRYWGGERVKLEDLSRDLLEKIRRIEQEEETVEAKRKMADQVLAEYEAKLEEFRARERDLRRQALKDARSIVEDAKRTAERLVGELKELKAKRAEPVAARAVERQIREEARGLAEAIQELECARERRPLGEVVAGSRAYVKPLSAEGVIVGGPDARGRVEVAVGAVRAEVRLGDLFEPEGEPAKPAAAGAFSFEAKMVSPEIDVRGMTAEEAWETVDKYIDDAALSGLPFVRVIHGKGKGVLANRIKEMLAAHPRVKSHRFGEQNEGGTGVTVIVLE
jgi:DNA mismatch repair protein MutS2